MLAAAAFPASPATARRDGDSGGGGGGVVPLFLATVFLFFVTYQLFGVAAAAFAVVLAAAAAFAACNVRITHARGFPFLRVSLAPASGGGLGRGVGGVAAARGMDAAAIMALPAAFGYKRGGGGGGAHGEAAAEGIGWAQCSICIGIVRVGEEVRRLPSCGHLFHAGCVDEWLRAHATCPLCRASVCAAAEDDDAPPELPV
uniref:RING-type E3 ubiquitin transferase n=1 Tax=Leersia perrieri TaxID=77586 RepID=A0A0D9WM33_9ORYZ